MSHMVSTATKLRDPVAIAAAFQRSILCGCGQRKSLVSYPAAKNHPFVVESVLKKFKSNPPTLRWPAGDSCMRSVS